MSTPREDLLETVCKQLAAAHPHASVIVDVPEELRASMNDPVEDAKYGDMSGLAADWARQEEEAIVTYVATGSEPRPLTMADIEACMAGMREWRAKYREIYGPSPLATAASVAETDAALSDVRRRIFEALGVPPGLLGEVVISATVATDPVPFEARLIEAADCYRTGRPMSDAVRDALVHDTMRLIGKALRA